MDIDAFTVSVRKRLDQLEASVGLGDTPSLDNRMDAPDANLMEHPQVKAAVDAYTTAMTAFEDASSLFRAFIERWTPLLEEIEKRRAEAEAVDATAAKKS